MPGGTDRQQVRTLSGVLESLPDRFCGVVFGTLLGPEATGPGDGTRLTGWVLSVWYLFVSGFLAAPITRLLCSFGAGVCGVCGTGLLFENYIVDASIFYKKQFPRI